MKKITTEIVEKIEKIKEMQNEVAIWLHGEVDCEGCDCMNPEIVSEPAGEEQGTDECKEWCNQSTMGDSCDWYYGDYYWETEVKGKYLKMSFEM